MRKFVVKIIQLLDGTPAVYGKRQAGQSVVELALITPILIILLAGLVEIGWFANNYLNLLDVSRTGARRGSVLQDQKSPLFWENKYSYVPTSLFDSQPPPDLPLLNWDNFKMAYETTPVDTGTDAERFRFRWVPAGSTIPNNTGEQPCDLGYVPERPFYDEIICTMITSMEPLSLNQANGVDDIVVSAFSLQLIDPTVHPEWLDAATYTDRTKPQMVVVGRYPSNANECDVQDAGGSPSLIGDLREGRDPFDFNGNDARDVKPPNVPDVLNYQVAGTFNELPGFDASSSQDVSIDVAHAEKQVGFSLYGNHKIPNYFCVGSEWTMKEIEDLMNLPDYGLVTNDERDVLPSQGVVMVEVFWEHEMLLKIPVLSPVYTAVGNQDGKIVIKVWAAFPLAAVEPHVQFP